MPHTHIEGTGKPIKVVAPVIRKKGCTINVKLNKEYSVVDSKGFSKELGWIFFIVDEDKDTVGCVERKDYDLNYGNWIVTEREQ